MRMDKQSWEIGVVELFYPDLAAAKAFYQDVFCLAIDREDDTSFSGCPDRRRVGVQGLGAVGADRGSGANSGLFSPAPNASG